MAIWRGVVKEEVRRAAQRIVLDVAERLRTPRNAEEIARRTNQQSSPEIQRQWMPFSTSFGNAGLALLFGQLDRCFPDQGWDRVAHDHLAVAARSLETFPVALPAGIFGGVAGLCFATSYLSRNGERYQHLSRTLDDLLLQETSASTHLPDPPLAGARFRDYDLIVGPSGVAGYLLLQRARTEVAPVLDAILDRLVYLSEWQDSHLRFFILPHMLPTEHHREQFPHGCTDCGLAHGVPGPLAVLSLARIHGVERPGLDIAIRRLAEWVACQRLTDTWGISWPAAVPPSDAGESPNKRISRDAWCYGGPGVARALWSAGNALDDMALQDLALQTIHAVRSRPIWARKIDSPIFCHGVAGLLQVVVRFANDTGDSFFDEMAAELVSQILNLYEPHSAAGFRDIEAYERRVDNPGLLEGAAGIALALLAATTDVEPAWDRLFLLS